ncbi:type I glutamate--ammonia ligase [Sphingomonas sp. MAH-20]|uniref:Glutamine synthetase n=1 Tax=Sphingomonas horti TaxID=2682842 RepID=A0A6I4J3I0_9SPHN|nr:MULTISPECIES: type I glutamate--ammonia ligase [Sphingomonas]MBA2919259.1 type I glutamate--ammonia ligase [Sphingomonas sp. CGMCC 1.13658]MVO79292.1 type I glutamate--ammonia ligase [Sphingomonas horti]
MPATAADILKRIQDEEIEWVDLRFTDPKGKWQHLSMVAGVIDEDALTDGLMFDGSSIAGWKAINESDMILKPDLDAAYIDPFSATPMLILFCDVVEPSTGELYSRDPRSTAKRAEAYLKNTGIGDTIYVGPEAEFFLFDDVRFENSYATSYYKIDDIELPTNSGREYEVGNLAHRPRAKGGYFPVAPVDSAVDIRGEMVSTMLEMGLPCDKHHHEVAAAQHELGLTFGTLVETADRMQIYKYVVHQVAQAYGKTATFMPKPIKDDNGSGMHTHMSIWQAGKPLFAGNGYAGLSDMCLYFIGGVIKHARALNAFTNPSTNSYKRLVPGYEAPVLLAYSSRNRSASCRIPYGTGSKAKRVEFRFPDALANPYLAYAALLMAGLDGIQNRLHPGDAMDKNLYDLPPAELADVPTVCGSLREALDALEADMDFLLKGDVFGREQIEAYIGLKREEVAHWEMTPSPVEFDMYYSS